MPGAVDILVHLTPCPIVVVAGGREFTIPAMDAVGWMKVIGMQPFDPYRIFPVLAGPEAVKCVDEDIWNEVYDDDELAKIALEALTVAADRGWWVVLRLLNSVAPHWHVLHVNNAAGMSLAGWLDELWSKTLEHMDPKHRAAWEHQIEQAPKGWEGEPDFDEEEKAFMNAMRAAQ